MKKLKNILFRKSVYIPLIAVVLIGAIVGIRASKNKEDYKVVAAARGDFVQEISVNGKVVPAKDVELSFESSGKISVVNVKVGNQVKTGQTLALLAGGNVYASVLGSQARLETERVKLRQLEAGNRPEEIQIKETALTTAKTSEKQATDSLKRDIVDSYITSDDVIKNKINQLFYRPPTSQHEDIQSNDFDFKKSLDKRKNDIDYMFIHWQESIANLNSSSYSEQYYDEALGNITIIRNFLNDVAVAVSEFTPSDDLSQATIDKYKSDLSSARSTINGQVSSLTTAHDSLQTAKLEVKTAENNLTLSKAGADPFDIEAQRAAVKSAEASVLSAQAEAGKTVITAPFDGVVTKVDITVGGLASPSAAAISLISAANFEIESFIPEADISKINVDDKAKVTLDAYGGETNFDAVITEIEPAETIVEGVSTYKTTLQFTSKDDRVKSGMTANIDIQGKIRNNILTVPQSALIYDDKNGKTIFVLKDGEKKPEERTVRTGQTDDKGNIEIIDGVTEGEKVVTNPPRK